ncbi:hypothetical protein AB0M44_47365 [Streptosporangium subroseum]|uniref:hypothetical protein n=1 Tax=Streptosporangium subroseum TaxID=106412 RepID=UPI00343EA8C5
MLIVARLDASTALAIVQQAGPLELAPGILLSLIPLLSAGLALLGLRIVVLHDQRDYSSRQSIQHWIFYNAAILIFSPIQSWRTTVAQIVAPIVQMLINKLIDLGIKRASKRKREIFRFPRRAKQAASEKKKRSSNKTYVEPEDSVLRDYSIKIKEAEEGIQKASIGSVDLGQLNDLKSEKRLLVKRYHERAVTISEVWKSSADIFLLGLVGYFAMTNFAYFFTDTSWLPAEKVQLDRGTVVVGYVLKSDESWTTILTLGRSIRTVKTDAVVDRQICKDLNNKNPRQETVTIWGFSSNSPNYPPCVPPNKPTPSVKKSEPASKPPDEGLPAPSAS